MRKGLVTKVLFCLLSVVAGWPLAASAVIVVRMETVLGDIDIELYDDVAPQTVANFLNYVKDGDYEDSFFHRSVPDFVIQGGGFRMPVDQPEPVPLDPPVANEYSLPNVRGTIAMAKSAGDPDSATSQWFINLVDNTDTLGPANNGGYTVFGKVIGNGMEVADAIAALPIVNAGSPFETLPVIDFSGDTVLRQHLVIVNRVVFVTPHIVVTPAVAAFDTSVPVGASGQLQVEISNDGMEDLVLGAIADTDVIEAPFDIVADTCSGQTLVSSAACTLTVRFTPEAEGEFTDSFNIPSNDPESPNVYVTLNAVGGPPVPDIEVSPAEGLAIGGVSVGGSGAGTVTLSNAGDAALTVSAISITGADAAEFAQTNDCTILDPGASCEVTVTLMPTTAGDKVATLTVASDDPDQPMLDIALSGRGYMPVPDIQVTRFFIFTQIETSRYNFGELLLGNSRRAELTVANRGEADLVIESIDIGGADFGDFSLTHDCSVLAGGQDCKLEVEFAPQADGVRSGMVTIRSNDPDQPVTEVTLEGIGRESWERYTLKRSTGERIRLLAPPATRIDRVGASDEPPPGDLPEGVRFEQGFIKFAVTLPRGRVGSAVAIVLPEGVTPTTYYKYGPTPDNAVDHWYEFMWDGYTGAVINGNVVTLYFVDGERGDSDLTRNGVILDPGAPGFSVMATEAEAATPDSGSSGGGGGGCSLLPHAGAGSRPVEWLAVLAFIAWLGLRRRQA